MLTVEGLFAGYGPIEALKGISLRVDAGETVALIGANGAGKTTTLWTLSGLLRPQRGKIEFLGRSLVQLPAHEVVRLGIAHSPEGRKVFPRLTVAENLDLGAFTRRDDDEVRRDRDRILAMFPVLEKRLEQLAGTLSGGEQQMLALGRALMSRPKLLLLDEPTLGLAPIIIERIAEAIRELNREGMTILLVEQNAELALRLSRRAYVLTTGTIAFADESPALLADPRVRRAYLGE
jgi:branched-chain amino acid transport system ATP-binding protein